MNRFFLVFASIAGAIAVLAGAILTHQLKHRMPEMALEVYEVAVRYQFYHVFALLAVGMLSEKIRGRTIYVAGICFIAGIIFFCGSLYILSAMITGGHSIPVGLGILTPLGGLGFILGWIFLSIAVLRGRAS